MYPAIYKATYWDEIDSTQKTVNGITFARSFTDAMDIIEQCYGDDLIHVGITLLEDSSVCEISEQVANYLLQKGPYGN